MIRNAGFFIRFLWELPQNLLGLLVWLAVRKRILSREIVRRRCLFQVTGFGVSLGSFIFWSEMNTAADGRPDNREHEFGHSVQSDDLRPLLSDPGRNPVCFPVSVWTDGSPQAKEPVAPVFRRVSRELGRPSGGGGTAARWSSGNSAGASFAQGVLRRKVRRPERENGVKKIEWAQTYSVGVRELDEQHFRFFEIVNAIQDASLMTDAGAPKSILYDLGEYAAYHFQTEEKYFDRCRYPAAEIHIREHREFEKKIAEFRKVYQSQKTFNPGVVREFARDWLIHHILIADRKYTACFHENGLK